MRNIKAEQEQAAVVGELVRQGRFIETTTGASLEGLARALEGKDVTIPFLMRFCFLSGLELGMSSTMVLAAHEKDLLIFSKLARELGKVQEELRTIIEPVHGRG